MNPNPVRIDNAINGLFLAAAASVFILSQALSLLDSARDKRETPPRTTAAQTQPTKPIAHA